MNEDFYVSGKKILGGRVTLDSLMLSMCFSPEEKDKIRMFAKCAKSGACLKISGCIIKYTGSR